MRGKRIEADRERAINLGLAVLFEDPRDLRRWMGNPRDDLGGKTPLEMMDTPEGVRAVEAVIINEAQVGQCPRPLREQAGFAEKITSLTAQARTVFGGQRGADAWLNTPNGGLENRCPGDVMLTPEGARQVEELLSRVRRDLRR